MNNNNSFFTFLILLGTSIMLSSTSVAQNNKALNAITIDELKNHTYFLASDFLGGRVSYEPGYKIAAEYCASQFKSAGLEPIMKDKEGNLTYFQEVPITKQTIGTNSSVILTSSGKTIILENKNDFKIVDKVRNYVNPETEVVFAGYGIEESDCNWNDYKNLDVEGKAVIILTGTPQKGGRNVLPDEIDKSYKLIEGFQNKINTVKKYKPSAILFIPGSEMQNKYPFESIPSSEGSVNYFYKSSINKEVSFHNILLFFLNPKSTNKIFKNQKYSPVNIDKEGIKGYKTFELEDLKLKPNFVIEKNETIICPNVIAVLKGTDENLKNEYISLGAHLDHIPRQGEKICNGADDNASGVVGVMEIAESMTMNPHKRSIVFMLFAAEELGLLGSQHFVDNPPFDLKSIKFNLNLDMIGRSSGDDIKTRAHNVYIFEKYLNSLKKYVENVNNESLKYPLNIKDAKTCRGRSDHTSFNSVNIPNMHFSSGHHDDLHRPTDDAEKIDYEKMQKIAQLSYKIVQKLANADKVEDFIE